MVRRVLIAMVVITCFGLIVWSGLWSWRAQTAPPAALAASPPIEMTPVIDESGPASPLEGKRAPAFSLRDLSGRQVTLASQRGKVVLLNFWATWCAPCRVEMPWFIDLERRYGAQGFTVLGIDKDYPEDLGKVPGFAREMRLNYPVLYGDGSTYAAYGCCDYLPVSYYIDRDGVVRSAAVGLGDRAEMEAKVQALLMRNEPTPKSGTTVAALQKPPAR